LELQLLACLLEERNRERWYAEGEVMKKETSVVSSKSAYVSFILFPPHYNTWYIIETNENSLHWR